MADDYYGLGDPVMLERIDRLMACGVSSLIDLPQIVVVGDQSSGKSSVLAGLIRKELPRDSGLCTRFATKIIFRRSEQQKISASIIAGADSSEEHRTTVEAWRIAEIPALDNEVFSSMMTQVHDVMGLSRKGSSVPLPTFSNDVFQLEISGPDQEHLSVIDVPGIFKNTTSGVTTKADIELVRQMVLTYMENPRSVMLAVIPANVDVATQEILELASDVDPNGDRTLGVLTKPDLVDKGAEHRVVDLMEGRTRHMKLGWHMVRNLGQQDLQGSSSASDKPDRQKKELDFFQTERPWSSLGKEVTGVESLRARLQDVLSTLVRKEFPKVKREVNKRLEGSLLELKNIGPERGTSHSQSAYLIDLSARFQRLAMLATTANYGSDEVFDRLEGLRLAPAITLRFEKYSDDMAQTGHTYAFRDDWAAPAPQLEVADRTEDDGWMAFEKKSKRSKRIDPSLPVSQLCPEEPSSLSQIKSRCVQADCTVDIDEMLSSNQSLEDVEKDGIKDWLRVEYERSRGFELGTFAPSMLATTMKKQAVKWKEISLGYVSDAVVLVHKFVTTAIDALCYDEALKRALTSALLEGLQHRYHRAIEQVHFLLEVELNGTPITANHYFNDNLQKYRLSRMKSEIQRHAFDDCSHGKVVRLEDLMLSHPMSNTSHIIEDIHDILKSYYKLVRKRFVDNVIEQATMHFLVTGPDTPLAFFSPTFVNSLTPGELEQIAGEAPRIRRQRVKLEKEIASLTGAKDILA